MPQLDPTQWFIILLSSWAILIYYAPLKITDQLINLPSPKLISPRNNPWHWPWQ